MHDFLTGATFSGNYDLQPHGVLVVDEHPAPKAETPVLEPKPELHSEGQTEVINR